MAHFISCSLWKFFTYLENKYSLQEAYDEVILIDGEFDLADALSFLLSNNFIQEKFVVYLVSIFLHKCVNVKLKSLKEMLKTISISFALN